MITLSFSDKDLAALALLAENTPAILAALNQVAASNQAATQALERANANETMTKEEVCKFLHIRPTKLYHLEQEGRLKARRLGKKNLYLRAEVQKLLNT